MKRYRGFLFDADNTLFDYDRAEKRGARRRRSAAPSGWFRCEALAAYPRSTPGTGGRFEQGTTACRP